MSVTASPDIRKDHYNVDLLGDLLDHKMYFIPLGIDSDGCGIMQSACWADDEYGQPGAACFRVLYGPEIAEPPFTDECPF